LGDIYADATYQFGQVLGPVDLTATVRVKLPTADEERGLGTGAADYYGEFTFSRTFGSTTPFALAGYRVLGDNAAYQLRNGAYVSGGAHFRVSAASVITAMLNWRQPIVAGGDESVDALLMVTHDLNARWRFTAYGLAGFTDASPDIGTGLQVGYRFQSGVRPGRPPPGQGSFACRVAQPLRFFSSSRSQSVSMSFS
jgi:hypothetical protein